MSHLGQCDPHDRLGAGRHANPVDESSWQNGSSPRSSGPPAGYAAARTAGPLAHRQRWRSSTGVWRAAKSRPISTSNCAGRLSRGPRQTLRATHPDRYADPSGPTCTPLDAAGNVRFRGNAVEAEVTAWSEPMAIFGPPHRGTVPALRPQAAGVARAGAPTWFPRPDRTWFPRPDRRPRSVRSWDDPRAMAR
jgi:hypothetical protein